MQQRQAIVGKHFGPFVMFFKKIPFTNRKVKQEVQWGSNVYAELVHHQDMALELGKHLYRKFIFEKRCDVLKGQHHLLVQLDADFKRYRTNDAHECWLHNCILAQVRVRQMHGLKNGLVEAVCLNSKLQNNQDRLLPGLWRNPSVVEVCEIVSGVVLLGAVGHLFACFPSQH